MKKKLPAFKTDDEAARFLDRKDLSDYINAENMVPARFEFERKTKNISMRIPATLLEAVKACAARQGIPISALSAKPLNASSRRRPVNPSPMISHEQENPHFLNGEKARVFILLTHRCI